MQLPLVDELHGLPWIRNADAMHGSYVTGLTGQSDAVRWSGVPRNATHFKFTSHRLNLMCADNVSLQPVI